MQKKFAEEPNILYSRLSEINTGVLAIVMTIIILEIQPPANMAHYVDFIHDIGVFWSPFWLLASSGMTFIKFILTLLNDRAKQLRC